MAREIGNWFLAAASSAGALPRGPGRAGADDCPGAPGEAEASPASAPHRTNHASVFSTMLWSIDPAARQPLHEQISACLRRGIADGAVSPGEQLPPAAELAGVLGVNANTVLQAYRSLRAEGLVEFRRGRGVKVASDSSGAASVNSAVLALLELGSKQGYGRGELAELIRSLPRPT